VTVTKQIPAGTVAASSSNPGVVEEYSVTGAAAAGAAAIHDPVTATAVTAKLTSAA